MFGMMPPEPLPEHKAVPLFWSNFTKFLTFVAGTAIVVYGVRHVENRAHEALFAGARR
jgi:hypothetical protein